MEYFGLELVIYWSVQFAVHGTALVKTTPV